MLVLTRRANEKLSFPQVGITVHFVRVQSGHVKVGVDAPRDIAIVRDEIADEQVAEAFVRRQHLRLPLEMRRGLRDQLQEVRSSTQLYRELITAGMAHEAEETFANLEAALQRFADNELLRNPDQERMPSVPGALVLLDDDANQRELLSGFLRLRGFHVASFSKSAESLQYLSKSDRPWFFLVNVRTERGIETLREVRADDHNRDIKLFAYGCSSPGESELKIGGRGVDRWFTEPLSPRLLVEALDGDGANDGRTAAARPDRSSLSTC